MTLYKWSQTASADATADSTINWAEGQAPSSVNDSARAMMAATAKYRDDIAGAIVTSGTSTAYAVSSYQVFDTLAHLNGQTIAFTPHTTNGATVTLNVDVLGARPLRTSPGVELPAGTIIQGTPYVATYNNGDGAFYLQGFFGNPYNIPLAAGMDYWAATAPNASFAFPIGQPISRTTYSALFSLIGTTYGPGDGSTTFNLPDKTGRVSAMKEASATRLTGAGSGVDGGTLGASGGAQNGSILQANLPAATLVTTIIDPGHGHPGSTITESGTAANLNVSVAPGGNNVGPTDWSTPLKIATNTTGITASTALGGSGVAFKIAQPTIVCNYIMRIV
jgi:microcystin-dependent protein